MEFIITEMERRLKVVKVGAYMIVKNEQECLGACLDSLKGFNEIVILDTGSTDKTAEVVKKFDCNYIAGKYEWDDNFAEARNESMKYAKSDWLVVIDADEVFKGSVKSIRNAIKKYPKANAFSVNTVSARTKDAHYSVRLHKNTKEIMWNGAIHNHLSVLGDEILEGMEIHYGYSAAHALDPDRALRILTKRDREKDFSSSSQSSSSSTADKSTSDTSVSSSSSNTISSSSNSRSSQSSSSSTTDESTDSLSVIEKPNDSSSSTTDESISIEKPK